MRYYVFFDLDGTLIVPGRDYASLKKLVFDILRSADFPLALCPKEEYVFRVFNILSEDRRFAALKEEILRAVNRWELESIRESSLMPGSLEILKALREKGVSLALLTMDGKAATNYALEKWSLKPFFDLVLTRDDVPFMKPSPLHVHEAIRLLRADPRRSVLVGDTFIDVRAAIGAGIRAVAFAKDDRLATSLLLFGATAVIRNLSDLLEALKSIWPSF